MKAKSNCHSPLYPAHYAIYTARVLFFLFLSLTLALPVWAEEDLAPATKGQESRRSFQTGTRFFDDAAISGGVYFFRRDRRRYDLESKSYTTNLNHASTQANIEFVSGFLGDVLGFDFGVFGSHDIMNKGAVDHEMNFEPWGNPWHPDWNKRSTEDGASVYKAALKAKSGPVWAQGGYFQPSGPGVMGVNWSIMPGTYRGVNAGADVGGFSVAMAWADAYKSPWFRNMNEFLKNDGETRVPWMWSTGLRYTFENGLTLEVAYGESKKHLKNAHVKSGYETELAGGTLFMGYHLYLMDDNDNSGISENDNFAGIASQHYVYGKYETAPWTWKLEATYTRAPMTSEVHQGQFAYRLTDRSGSSNGSYDVWWDARSDWNAHNEKAFFVSVERNLDDLLPIRGFYAGAGTAFGFDGEGYNTARHLKEWAFNLDFGYVKPEGPLEGAFVKIHYTEYRNGTNKPDWINYKNGFQSEHDIKLFAGIPFSF